MDPKQKTYQQQSHQTFSRTSQYKSSQQQTQVQQQRQKQNQSHDQTQDLLADTTATLEEMLRIANETREMATNASLELNKQGEQLEHMRNKMDTIDENLANAKKGMNNLEVKWYDPRTWF